jgi:hypothetical protein
MHDKAQALIPEGLETSRNERLWGCCPRSDPLERRRGRRPLSCSPPRLTSTLDAVAGLLESATLSAGFVAGFCAIAGMDGTTMKAYIKVFAISLFMHPTPQKCLANLI